ncbi:hypothetical protein M427DRAFT_65860 [Gonapodya prolifera JEL478]|uniref:Uncharacterized protein n=1 Tax=Gonapodya prolifera (strain JEL478) TaxID=1344416 RepID=A0A139AYZ3_GONPJ|nr:hypothetical protein M427DRAFT_65860 [Gonapodya prolifera JEL478]|eukprot:KXS21972.1 hypothetical protein M427DRAFT_65860 [Gonapodya prolifera JEL478]
MSPPIAVSSPRSQHADASPAARIDANSDGTTQIHARITGDADSDSRATSGWSVNQDEGVDGSRANLLGDDGDARENADTLARRRAQLRVQVGRAEATLQESPRRGGETGQQRVDAGAGVGRIADTGGNARQQTQKSAQLALGDATRPADVAAAGVSQTQLAAPPHNPSALPSPPTASKLTPPPLPSAYTKKEKRHACYRPPAFKRSDISSFAYHLGPYTDLAYDPSWHADALVVEPDQLRAWVETAVAAQKEKSTLSNRPPTMTVAIPSNPVIDLDLTKHDSTAPEGPRTPLSGLSFARPKEDPPRRGLTVSLGSPSRRGHTGASPGASLHHDDDSSEDEDFPSPSRSQNPLTMVARAISRRATSKIPEGSTAMSRGMSSSAVKGSDLLRSPRISSPLGRKSFQRGRSPIEEDDEDSDSDDHQPSSAPGQVTRPPRLPGASLPLWVQPPPARAHTTSAAANASSLLTPLSSPPSADSFLPSPLHLTTGANVATISPSTPAPSTTLRLPVPTMLFLVSVSALLPRRKLAAALTSAPSVSPLNPRAVLGVLLRDAYVSAPGKVVDVVRRVGQASGWQVPVFLECQQGDGGDGFDRCARVVEMCREEVGGVVLWDACVVVGEDFTPVPRPPWGPSKAPLARLLRLLTTESSLRSSFLAVSATHTRGVPLPPALERHRLRWATERGFVQWAAGGRGERVEDMPRGTVRKVHDTDVFEWCAEPAALAVRAKAEKAWRAPPPPPVPGGAGPGLVKVRTAVGKHFPDAASFLARLDAAGCNVVVQPQAPAAPTWAAVHDAAVRVAQGTADPPLNEIAAGVVRVHSGCHPAPASPGSGPGVVVSVGHLVGTTACPALTARVAGRVFEAMTRLEERGLLAGFKVDQDVPTKDDPIRKEFRDTVGALGRVAESAWVAKVREVTESAAGGGVLGAVLAGAVEEIVEAAGRLKEDLDAGRWVVWTAGRAGFRVHDEAEVEGGGARVWGVAGRKADGVVGVYISDAHPHPAEILFNLYLQHNHNLSPHSAIAGESAMASLLTPPTRSLTDPSLFPIPTRVALEMTTSGPPELTSLCALLYARNRIIVSDTTGDAALKAITMTVHDRAAVLAGFELDERTEYKRALMEMASGEYRPASEFERRLGEEVGEASLETGGRERFLNLVGTVGELLNDSDPTVVRSAAAVYLSLWKACRRLAWEELKVALRCKNARYLPDCDQVAVAMEMTTTQGNLIGVFECTSLELAKVMSEKLRQEAKKDEVPEEIEEEGRRDEFSFVDGGKDLFNSFVFVYPIILDLLLVSFFGSGIFYTDQLDSTMENNISITLLVCFPVMGALSNSVFYELLAQKLSMIFIVSLVTSVAVGAPFAAVYGVRELLIIPYAFFFMLFMVLFGTLLLLRDTSRLFFLSEGPQAVVVGVVALLVAPVVTITALQSASTVVVLLVYIGSLILSDGFMLYKLFAMSKDLIEWPSRLDVPKESAIATIFEKKLPKPTLWMGEDVMEHQKRVRLWERSAREYYAAKVETYLNQTLPGLHPLVAERCEQWKLESPLMNWYLEMTGISHPPRFGKEWDSILGQAIVKLKAKYQADKLNRGDLLFSIEAPAILFGALYFFFIFIDRWGNLLGRGVTSVFGKLVSSDSATKAEDVAYMTGIRYGTLFILLGSGFLEIALLRLYASEKVGKEVRLSKEVSPDLLLSEYKAKARLEYLKELSIFVAELLFVFGLVSLIGMKSIFESTSTLYAFWLATIGYFGLLVGLFHKLILRGENYLNVGVSVIVALGIALSAITLRFTGNRLYQLLVSAVACWAFAGITAYFSHRESAFHRRGFRLSPSLNTSGYKRIGKPLNDLILERLNKLSQKLDRQKGKLRRLVPASPEVAARVLERAKPTGGGMDGPLQILEHQAFPNLFEQLSAATTDYRTDKVLVYMAPEKMRKEFEELGVFAIASLVPVPQGSQEHIAEIFAIIPKGCEFPENYVMEVVVHEYLDNDFRSPGSLGLRAAKASLQH